MNYELDCSFNDLKKNLKKDFSGFREIRVAVLADFASQLLCQALRGWGYAEKLNLNIQEADYNQISQMVIDPGSELYSFNPDFVVIAQSSQKLQLSFSQSAEHTKAAFSQAHLSFVKELTDTINSRLQTKIIYFNFPEFTDAVFGNFSNKTSLSFLHQQRSINTGLMLFAQQNANFSICDISSLQNLIGSFTLINSRLYLTSDNAFSLDGLPWIAKNVCDIIKAYIGQFKKCLILDLDNTTWGGIIGDDGLENIQIGDLGIGKAFMGVQRWAKQLKERGIILAICSKNDETVAKEPFLRHPDMILRLEDISIFMANWDTKVDNIRHIQSILNIGFDSMVFLDDNPFERNIVKQAIPAITVPELPEDPSDYLAYLQTLNLFETASFTADDSARTRQYQEESQRVAFQKTFEDEDGFLKSLDMVCDIQPFNKFNTPRVAQLSQRSNQFNLRTVRYTEEDVNKIIASPDMQSFAFSLTDKYGNYGLISIVVIEKETDSDLFISNWLMSCRVLKRGMENLVLNTVVAAAKEKNISTIKAEYIPTAKNGMVKDHYQNLGFQANGSFWELDVESYASKNCFIKSNFSLLDKVN